MKEQLIQYGFTYDKNGWLVFQKDGWCFEYSDDFNYMWMFSPEGDDESGICLNKLTYEKIVKLIDFITEYE